HMVWHPEHSMPYLRAYDGTAEALDMNSSESSDKTARKATVRINDAAGTTSFIFIFFPLN
ncbi:MAG: hypothetical protein WBM28_05000, partial [Burkholderiales bacterium]